MSLLRLLIHHGVWNEFDHDEFKKLIVTCKGIYQYVCKTKPLVRMLFQRLSMRLEMWQFGCISESWILNGKLEGNYIVWSDCTKKQIYWKVLYRNGLRNGPYVEWFCDDTVTLRMYQNGLPITLETTVKPSEHYPDYKSTK